MQAHRPGQYVDARCQHLLEQPLESFDEPSCDERAKATQVGLQHFGLLDERDL